MVFLKVDPKWDPLQSDSRFQDLWPAHGIYLGTAVKRRNSLKEQKPGYGSLCPQMHLNPRGVSLTDPLPNTPTARKLETSWTLRCI